MSGSFLARLLALTRARSLEFLRDRSSLGWNILLPLLLVAGLAFMFSGPEKPLFKVAVLATPEAAPGSPQTAADPQRHPFLATRYVDFFPVADRDDAVRKVARHQIDMLLEFDGGGGGHYWVNTTSPRGYILERLLAGQPGTDLTRNPIEGREIRYVEWLTPGILGMSMMFSCLFGVGYVIVRYRKSGYLKRLKATPLSALEFIGAQVLSRLLLVMSITTLVFIATDSFIHFRMQGSYLDLFLVTLLGASSMIALGLTVAARVTSEELAGGLLNVLSWPMMFLSGVWFSVEGMPQALQALAQLLPLTHLLAAARAIMIDGAGLADLAVPLAVLGGMTVLFLALGAWLFRWTRE